MLVIIIKLDRNLQMTSRSRATRSSPQKKASHWALNPEGQTFNSEDIKDSILELAFEGKMMVDDVNWKKITLEKILPLLDANLWFSVTNTQAKNGSEPQLVMARALVTMYLNMKEYMFQELSAFQAK
jgi:hypothetical protein